MRLFLLPASKYSLVKQMIDLAMHSSRSTYIWKEIIEEALIQESEIITPDDLRDGAIYNTLGISMVCGEHNYTLRPTLVIFQHYFDKRYKPKSLLAHTAWGGCIETRLRERMLILENNPSIN